MSSDQQSSDTQTTTDSDASPTANADETPTANSQPKTSSDAGLRAAIAAWLGASMYEKRNTWTIFDWPKDIGEEQYYATYLRHPFAKPVVDRPAFTSWRDGPTIVDEGADEETDFEADIRQANQALDLWSYGERLDRLAGIGRYGLLVWVTTDVTQPGDLSDEFDPSDASADGLDMVNQIKVFSEVSVDNIEWGGIENADKGRWGKPVSFAVDFSPEAESDKSGDGDESTYEVHHSRVTAAPATRLLDDDFFGRPRLEPVFNTLRDMEKVLGAVAEMAFRGADKGIAISHDPTEVNVDSDEFWEQHSDELQDWFQGLKPALETTGDIQELGGRIADVSNIFSPQVSALSAATGIPGRVFEGDPAGALAAASEDTQAYFGMIQERRHEYVAPHIVRSMVSWLIDAGVVSDPQAGTVGEGKHLYDVDWDPLRVLSEQEQAEVARTHLEAVQRQGVLVREARDMIGLDSSPDWLDDDLANSFLSEIGGSGGGGAAGGPGQAIEDALAANRRDAEAAARTEARIQRGQTADANADD